jgi:alpha-tubulin suppressor-like RCC1 family protein
VTLNGSITIGASEGTSLDDALVLATNGQQSFCAVQTTGAVRCWGDNSVGELGDGTTTSSSVAMAVTGITKADGIASDGKNSFCTVLTTGVMDCWGENTSGELGNGTTTSSSVPVTVTGITNAISVTSDGEGSYCAVLASGSIACWGSNMSGQLGDGTMTGSSVPVAVTGITNASTVTSDGGGSYCAVLATGIVSCWGANDFGQLGDGSTASSSVPTATGITDAVTVSSDTDSSFCAVLTTGAVECWGANFAGELGDGTTMRSTVPVAVTGITTAVSIADDGAESYCAVLSTGAVACWGLNSFGELGDATTTNSDVPVAVLDITNAASITSDGDDSFCALLTSGSIDCWGANFSGELGNGSSSASSTPVAVSDITTATDVSGGIHPAGDTEHAYCAVVIAAEVDCWGSNKFGELGNATTIASPVPVTVVQP